MTSAVGFAAGLRRCARHGLKAAVEASGITPWICQLLKDLGVRVVTVNPNRVRLIAESRKKSDRVDGETLAEPLQLGGLPEVHQPSIEARRLRTGKQIFMHWLGACTAPVACASRRCPKTSARLCSVALGRAGCRSLTRPRLGIESRFG